MHTQTVPVRTQVSRETGSQRLLFVSKRRCVFDVGCKYIAGSTPAAILCHGRFLQVVANTLGLNDSKYQYVIDALEADEMRAKREQRDEEDRRKVC